MQLSHAATKAFAHRREQQARDLSVGSVGSVGSQFPPPTVATIRGSATASVASMSATALPKRRALPTTDGFGVATSGVSHTPPPDDTPH